MTLVSLHCVMQNGPNVQGPKIKNEDKEVKKTAPASKKEAFAKDRISRHPLHSWNRLSLKGLL